MVSTCHCLLCLFLLVVGAVNINMFSYQLLLAISFDFFKILTGVQSSFTPSSNRHCSLVPCSMLTTQIMYEATEYSPPILFFKLGKHDLGVKPDANFSCEPWRCSSFQSCVLQLPLLSNVFCFSS